MTCFVIFDDIERTNMATLDTIKDILQENLDIAPENVDEDSTFESLGVDSLDTVEMVMDLEQELGVELEIEEKIATVGELVDFVESKVD